MSKIRVLINPNAGVANPLEAVVHAVARHWDAAVHDVTFQTSLDAADGRRKAERAVVDGVEILLVAGGDGMINTVGQALLGSPVALGVIPTGSGNGFARHFNIPLVPEDAVRAFVGARRTRIDVGQANGHPFFVTCSMAWEAAIARSFEKSPVRGIWPYIFAAAYEYVAYTPQPFEVMLDDHEILRFPGPMIFTIANLTQYGGGAKIAPHAQPDDGELELVVIPSQDIPQLLVNLPRLYDGTLDQIPEMVSRRFKKLNVRRTQAGPIQVDGEIIEAVRDVEISVIPQALTVLVPAAE